MLKPYHLQSPAPKTTSGKILTVANNDPNVGESIEVPGAIAESIRPVACLAKEVGHTTEVILYMFMSKYAENANRILLTGIQNSEGGSVSAITLD